MSRIKACFEKLKSENRKALVAFVTSGDPDIASTQKLFEVIEKNGADIIELGVPFSDPLADGPVIQAASQRSLKGGTTLKKIVKMVGEIRKKSELPIVLMSSFNPIFVYGQEVFVKDAVKAGVDGVIIPDLPPEEADEFEGYARDSGLDTIYLLAPTSTENRVRMVAERSRGFIYYISLTGTTGARDSVATDVGKKVAAIKKVSPIPVLVGFGISVPEQAKEAGCISDGVIVGSAIVRLIADHKDAVERDKKVGEFVAGMKQALLEAS